MQRLQRVRIEIRGHWRCKSTIIARADRKALAARGGTADLGLVGRDYRAVDGAKMPHKIVIKRDGKNYVEAEVTELKTGKIDSKLFAQPSAD